MPWTIGGFLLVLAAVLAGWGAVASAAPPSGAAVDGNERTTRRAITVLVLLTGAVAVAATAAAVLSAGGSWQGRLAAFLVGVAVVTLPLGGVRIAVRRGGARAQGRPLMSRTSRRRQGG